jgi:hypothetical protein
VPAHPSCRALLLCCGLSGVMHPAFLEIPGDLDLAEPRRVGAGESHHLVPSPSASVADVDAVRPRWADDLLPPARSTLTATIRTIMPTSIVTTHYRYKRPPRKKKPVLLEVPAIVTPKPKAAPAIVQQDVKPGNDNRTAGPKARIVQATKPKRRRKGLGRRRPARDRAGDQGPDRPDDAGPGAE